MSQETKLIELNRNELYWSIEDSDDDVSYIRFVGYRLLKSNVGSIENEVEIEVLDKVSRSYKSKGPKTTNRCELIEDAIRNVISIRIFKDQSNTKKSQITEPDSKMYVVKNPQHIELYKKLDKSKKSK